VTDIVHRDGPCGRVNVVDDPINANSETVGALRADELGSLAGKWVVREGLGAADDGGSERRWELTQIAFG
jgi:hypothetical protein